MSVTLPPTPPANINPINTHEPHTTHPNPTAQYQHTIPTHAQAHRIKNEKSALSKAVRGFQAHFRLLITGTPLQVRNALRGSLDNVYASDRPSIRSCHTQRAYYPRPRPVPSLPPSKLSMPTHTITPLTHPHPHTSISI